VDDLRGVKRKNTTTVAMAFGRLSFPGGIRLYPFGTPGQERFWFMWDRIAYGAVGALVLVDTRRPAAGFSSIDFFEHRRIPVRRRRRPLRRRPPLLGRGHPRRGEPSTPRFPCCCATCAARRTRKAASSPWSSTPAGVRRPAPAARLLLTRRPDARP
jgi:hypothetical protein